jgi:hypothetical protein
LSTGASEVAAIHESGVGNEAEVPLLYAASAIGVAFIGPGAFSFDSLLGLTFFTKETIVAGILVLSVVGALVVLTLPRPAQRQASAA